MDEVTERARRGFEMDPVSRGFRSVSHPVVVVAIAVLLLNDHYLKAEYPGWLTGKVSDFCGLVFFPLLLGVLIASVTRSRYSQAIASFATAAWFTAMKTSSVVAGITESGAEAVLGLPVRIIVDPSDLIALPMVGVGWKIWRRAGSSAAAEGRRFRKAAVVALAALASMATSIDYPEGVISADNTDTEVWVGVASIDEEQPGFWYRGAYGTGYRSSDGGMTWENAAWPDGVRPDPEQRLNGIRCEPHETSTCYSQTDNYLVEGPGTFYAASQDGGVTWVPLPADAPTPDPWRSYSSSDAWQVRGPACLTESGGACFRVFDPDGQTVTLLEVSTDQGATWGPSWTPSPRLPDRNRFAPQDVAVDERTGNLVVAIGTGGVVIRTPAGRWTTAAVGPADAYGIPTAFPPSSWPMAALWAIWTFVVSLAGGMWLVSQPPIARSANWRLASTVPLATAALVAIISVTANYPYTVTVGPSWLRLPIVLTVVVAVPVTLVWLLITYSSKHVPKGRAWRTWLWAAGLSLIPIVVSQLADIDLI
ncbi:MAG: hypothetical protein GY926_22350 [bacterium]|nr:hypothetical protein [bacterium]